jgi:NAD+ kinase
MSNVVKKVAIVSYFKPQIKKFLKNAKFVESTKPELVIAYGGDGTFLYAEEKYPGIPKLFIYHSNTCRKCSIKNVKHIIMGLNKYHPKTFFKIEARIGKRTITALNDINLHYNPPRALRFKVKVNKKIIADNVIGDGVLISTPFGSNAYFRSITGKSFKKGVGIAFNNSTKRLKPLIVSENSKIEIEILREKGIVAFDTSKKIIKIKKGDRILVKRSNKKVNVLLFKN